MSSPLKPPTGSSGGDFEQHPAGSFMAVCADVYVKEEENFFYGKAKDAKEPTKLDNRKTVTKAYLVFLTERPTADGKSSYVSAKENYSWGGTDKVSNLFKLVQGWYPTATPEQIRDMDLRNLVGKNAYITVTQNAKGYASVASASAAPNGATKVAIPSDFKTYDQRQAEKEHKPIEMRKDHPPVGNFPAGPAHVVPGAGLPGQVPDDDVDNSSPF
jgi:hypothetical protein